MKLDDFYHGLKGDDQQSAELTASAEHFVRLKQQTGLEAYRQEQELEKVAKLSDIDPFMLAIPAIGAAIGGAGTYLSSRPNKDKGGTSADERATGAIARSTQPDKHSGYLAKLRHAGTNAMHEVAKASREHPLKAALLGSAGGALSGYGLTKLLRGGK